MTYPFAGMRLPMTALDTALTQHGHSQLGSRVTSVVRRHVTVVYMRSPSAVGSSEPLHILGRLGSRGLLFVA